MPQITPSKAIEVLQVPPPEETSTPPQPSEEISSTQDTSSESKQVKRKNPLSNSTYLPSYKVPRNSESEKATREITDLEEFIDEQVYLIVYNDNGIVHTYAIPTRKVSETQENLLKHTQGVNMIIQADSEHLTEFYDGIVKASEVIKYKFLTISNYLFGKDIPCYDLTVNSKEVGCWMEYRLPSFSKIGKVDIKHLFCYSKINKSSS